MAAGIFDVLWVEIKRLHEREMWGKCKEHVIRVVLGAVLWEQIEVLAVRSRDPHCNLATVNRD